MADQTEQPDPILASHTPARDEFGRVAEDVPEGFVALKNELTGGVTFVPDLPGVVERHEALGWARVDDPDVEQDVDQAPTAPAPPAKKATAKSDASDPAAK